MERSPRGRRPARPRDRPPLSADAVRDIEAAFVGHWSLLGRWPGARLVDEDGVLRFESPIPKIPYNGVIRTVIEEAPDDVVTRVVDAYRHRRADFYWAVQPSSQPSDLGERLQAAGLRLAEVAKGMSLDLDDWVPREPPHDEVVYAEVLDEDDLRDYADVNVRYWELEDEYRELAWELNRHWFGDRAPGRRWVAYLDGQPVAKAYLSFSAPEGVAAIYGMAVRPEARGRGVAGRLTDLLLDAARAEGRRRVVLHSSEMAVNVYRRAGFVDRCEFRFFATAPIWSGKH